MNENKIQFKVQHLGQGDNKLKHIRVWIIL